MNRINDIQEQKLKRYYYSDEISVFLQKSNEEIIGILTLNNDFALEQTQRNAWKEEIKILKEALKVFHGNIYFEYSVPRMGKRIDVLLLIGSIVFVLEFKVGEREFSSLALDQVVDYSLDLKNFHESSHNLLIAPILIATEAKLSNSVITFTKYDDGTLHPIKTTSALLCQVIKNILNLEDKNAIDKSIWENSGYHPSPTIVEAAMALYNGHSVQEITRNDASARNLLHTTKCISSIINIAKNNNEKSICFVTGVPGAGKTLVGLNIATDHIDEKSDLYSVFLSGNGPLVAILREALSRDKIKRMKNIGKKIKKYEAMSEVKMFIQNIHHFRDDCLIDITKPPIEHVAIFDEAQRAWNLEQTSNFMKRKKNKPDFAYSEPEFLISCLNRHSDWAVIICLVGGGQEINTGEAGIGEWLESIKRSFSNWKVYISPNLTDSEYNLASVDDKHVIYEKALHLNVSMRSFRSEHVSLFVKHLLDLNKVDACSILEHVIEKYPIVITRDITKAKKWLKNKARGTERYGIVVSSQAERLKPYSIDVKTPVDPVHWFLDHKNDIRSSYFLEDVATEFHVQGLELDWVCITWDADFRFKNQEWECWSFSGDKWNHIRKAERKIYLKNAYRVLLTRARQGMVIVVPPGDIDDLTRKPEFYDETYHYLLQIGLEEI